MMTGIGGRGSEGSDDCCHFVDEAGDLTLFDRHGRVIIGSNGCRKTFMLGVAHVPDPAAAHEALEALRADLMSRPELRDAPSMQPEARKTALAFHGSKDLPQVRDEVFRLIGTLGVKVYVAIRRKWTLIPHARRLKARGQRFDPNSVYDDLVKRVFRDRLHKGSGHSVVFARRDNAERADALEAAIGRARQNFAAKWGKRENQPPVAISSGYPYQYAGLQIVDYYLWGLQRLYEGQEERYFDMVSGDYRLIMDLDAKHNKPYGEWYCDSNRLSLSKMKAL